MDALIVVQETVEPGFLFRPAHGAFAFSADVYRYTIEQVDAAPHDPRSWCTGLVFFVNVSGGVGYGEYVSSGGTVWLLHVDVLIIARRK